MSFRVRFTREAEDDLLRLYGFLVAQYLEMAERALQSIHDSIDMLKRFPFSCRKAAPYQPRLRELIIPFGGSGYVTLFEIEDAKTVTILAVRQQREDDYW